MDEFSDVNRLVMEQTIGVVITDGVGYRNYVLSSFLSEVAKKYKKVYIYSGLPKRCYDLELIPNNIEIIDLEPYLETNKVWFYRKLKEVAHMFLHRDFYGINDNLIRGYPKTNTKRSIIIKSIYKIASVFHSEKTIQFYEKIQFRVFRKDPIYIDYKSLLKKHFPSQLFFTHQRPPYLAPLLVAAKQLKIPSTAFIFSWDNLASKGRMLGTFDNYLVWSKLMHDEMIYFYPEVKKSQIKVVGTPQFEPYILDKYAVSKDDFLTKFSLDIHKKIICYSCADADIGRNDETHIRAILSFISKRNDLQLLVRTSPAEDGKRFEKLKNEFPEVVWNFPKWFLSREGHAEAWSQRLPLLEDVVDLKSILKYSDVNVNMLSTMSLDFMLFDKPVVNTVFGNKANKLYDDQRFLNFKHYEYVIKSKAVTIAKNEKELHKFLQEAIEQPEYRKENRKQLLDLEIGAPLQGTSERIVRALKEFS